MNTQEMPVAANKPLDIVVYRASCWPTQSEVCPVVRTATLPFEDKKGLLSERPLMGRRPPRHN